MFLTAVIAKAMAGAIAAVFAASCAVASAPIVGQAEEALPRATLEDWATYGEALVVVTADSERAGTLSAQEKQRGEGFASRTVSFTAVSDLWSRPGSKNAMPAQIAVANGGWIVRGDTRTELLFDGQTRAEVGRRYVALFTYSDVTAIVDPVTRKVTPGEGTAWTLMDVVPLDGDKIAAPNEQDAVRFPARQAIAALTPEQSGRLLQSIDPDPAAARYMDLDPVVRFQNTQLDQAKATPPTPAEGER